MQTEAEPHLRNEDSSEEAQYVNFILKIFKADAIPRPDSGIMAQVKNIFSMEVSQLLDPYVEVFLGGLKGTTSKKKRTVTPCWNQQIVFTLKFPIPSQPLVIQVRDDEIMINNVVGTAVIHLDTISNSESGGFLPTFGPCYVYLSKSRNGPNETDISFRGRLFMALSTEIISNPSLSKSYVVVEPTTALPEGTCGQEMEFLLFACIRDVTMIEKKVAEKALRFTLQIGNVPEYASDGKTCCASRYASAMDATQNSSIMDSLSSRESSQPDIPPEYCSSFMTAEVTNKRLHNIPINELKECMWLKSSWPDYRRRMYISNILEKATQKIEFCLHLLYQDENMERALKDLEDSITYYLRLLKENWGLFFSKTQLDKERWKMYQKLLTCVLEVAMSYKSMEERVTINAVFPKLKKLLKELKSIKDDPQPALPDVIVWMENNQKRIGYSKIVARDLLYAASDVEKGVDCGKIRSIFLRSLSKKKGILHLAKLDICLWLGTQKYLKQCLECLPEGFDYDVDDKEGASTDCIPRVIRYYEKQIYQLHVYIYQARFLPWSDMSKFPSPVAQFYIGNRCLSTQIQESTLNPIWDETLIFNDLVFYGNINEMASFSPDVVVEIFNYNPIGKSTYLCRGVIQVFEKESTGTPLLRWYKMNALDPEDSTEILAAFEVVLTSGAEGDAGLFENKFYDVGPVMPIPQSIRPRYSPHRIEILFWGLRELKRVKLSRIEAPRIELECGGNIVQSSVITNYKKHSNFKNMFGIIDMELPERESYFPALTIKLLDCKSYGRRNILASHVIHSLKKYVVKPHGELLEPKFDRLQSQQGEEHSINDTTIDIEPFQEHPFYDSYIFQIKGIAWTNSKKFASEDDEDEDEDWWSRFYISRAEMPQNKKTFPSFPKTSVTGRRRSTFGFPVQTTLDIFQQSQHRTSLIPYFQKVTEEFANGDFRSPSHNLDAQGFTIYPCELENVPDFDGFKDWLHSFELTREHTFAQLFRETEKTVAIFKGCFRIYELPLPSSVVDPLLPISDNPEGLFYGLPENKPMKVLVRVYIVQAIDLTASDITHTSDAYIVIHSGAYKFSDKENYVSKKLNPVFGKCFEFVANFPNDSMLHIQVMDWDLMGADDLIGETKIDLENRFYSRYRPTCGLARTYETSGPNAWRDVHTPTEILTNLCQENGLGTPEITEKDVRIANIVYDFSKNPQDEEANKQNMALYLLHLWKDISPGRYSLVPEHLETRTLYHPSKPGESQGKLVMWVDMFPENSVPPFPPKDISKRKPIGYELRVIVWNTDEVVLADDAFFTGEKMSDIYVKGWLTGEDIQKTDVHYRSLTGEGNFNWRFIFPFDYLPVERKIVLMKKVTAFSWDETEFKMPPELKLQVFDADHFKSDDFLGEITLDLRQFPRGAKSVDLCSLEILKDYVSVPQVSLFKQRRIRGWWPASVVASTGEKELTGKVEVELQLLKKEEAEKNPAGLGRKEPDPLPNPKRPETSFANFLHPLKTFRYALWKRYKKTIIKMMIFAALTLILVLFVYSTPGYTVKKLIGA